MQYMRKRADEYQQSGGAGLLSCSPFQPTPFSTQQVQYMTLSLKNIPYVQSTPRYVGRVYYPQTPSISMTFRTKQKPFLADQSYSPITLISWLLKPRQFYHPSPNFPHLSLPVFHLFTSKQSLYCALHLSTAVLYESVHPKVLLPRVLTEAAKSK